MSDLISDINVTMQRSIMWNVENKDKATVNSNEKIKQKYNFVEQKNGHEKVDAEIVSDIFNDVQRYKNRSGICSTNCWWHADNRIWNKKKKIMIL